MAARSGKVRVGKAAKVSCGKVMQVLESKGVARFFETQKLQKKRKEKLWSISMNGAVTSLQYQRKL